MRIPVKINGRYPEAAEDYSSDYMQDARWADGPERDSDEFGYANFEPEDREVDINEHGRPEAAEPASEGRDDISGAEQGDWKDKYVRLLADFENYKRHAEAERERLSGIGKEAVLDDLFNMVEHMERAIKAAKEAGETNGILKGLEMVYRELLSVLEKHGAQRIPARGEPFDPRLHEAVAAVRSDDVPEGTVIEEVRPGFIRGVKLLRPASVVVSK